MVYLYYFCSSKLYVLRCRTYAYCSVGIVIITEVTFYKWPFSDCSGTNSIHQTDDCGIL